jgi:uncharacterized membrane protein
MTTKITVDAHAGWPVEVTLTQVQHITSPEGDDQRSSQDQVIVVDAHTKREFYITQQVELKCRELQYPSPTD